MTQTKATLATGTRLVDSLLDELIKNLAVAFIDDDIDVTKDAPVGRLLVPEIPRSHTTCDGRIFTLGRSDSNVIANVRQQNKIGCIGDLDRNKFSIVVRSIFALGAVLIIN